MPQQTEFPQKYDEHGAAVCCGCVKPYVNNGEGTLCTSCRNEIMMELNMDYELEKDGGFDHMST